MGSLGVWAWCPLSLERYGTPGSCSSGASVFLGLRGSNANSCHRVLERLLLISGCWMSTWSTSVRWRVAELVRGGCWAEGEPCALSMQGCVPLSWRQMAPAPHSASSVSPGKSGRLRRPEIPEMHLVASSLITTICLPGRMASASSCPRSVRFPSGVCNNRELRSESFLCQGRPPVAKELLL